MVDPLAHLTDHADLVMASSDPDARHPASLDLSSTHGVWIGEEILHAGPGVGERLSAKAVLQIRPAYGGRGTASDYEQRVGGVTSVSAHTVVLPGGRGDEVMVHTTTPNNPPQLYRGTFREGVFDLEIEIGGQRQHLVQDFSAGDRMETRLSLGDGGQPVFEGSFRKVPPAPKAGTIGWHDLTVADAPGVRDFYAAVVGWKPSAVPMGDYEDFAMVCASGEAVSGVCHARGANANLPATWLLYVHVGDLEVSLATAERLGGTIVAPIRAVGDDRMAVISDPAGATLALYEARAAREHG